MRRITNIGWLDSHTWGLKGFGPGATGHDGFRVPALGVWIDCPDYRPKETCKHCVFCQTPEYHGYGFVHGAPQLIEYEGEDIAFDNKKANVRRLRRLPCTTEVLDEALRRCGFLVHRGNGRRNVQAGEHVVSFGSGKQTVKDGGEGRHYGSGPQTVKAGGWGNHYGSGPQTVQNGGEGNHYGSGPQTVKAGGHGCYYGSGPQTVKAGGWGNHRGSGEQIVEDGGRGWHNGGES